uniref:PDZ domain-containing protein n=1 Tax=Steinernema glaseri TaxID=37863 RepID=A0A1I7ZI27_9BILA
MYADDVDDDSDFTESTPTKSQRTSRVSAVSETRSVPREAAFVSVTPKQSRTPPQPQPRTHHVSYSPSQTKSSPTITTTSKSDDAVVVKGNHFVALVHRKAVNKGDLPVQKGDILKIHSTRKFKAESIDLEQQSNLTECRNLKQSIPTSTTRWNVTCLCA